MGPVFSLFAGGRYYDIGNTPAVIENPATEAGA